MVTWEVKFCECRKSPNNVAFDEAVKLSCVSQALSMWLFSVLFYWKVWTHPLSLCSFPVQSPLCSMTAKNKKHYSLVLFVLFSPFCFCFFFFLNLFLVKLGLVKAQSTYFYNKQRNSKSVQVLPSLGLFYTPSFFWMFACWGVRLCWLLETDMLQEFWKQTSLTLFSRLWLLFSPLFFSLKTQASPTFLL